MLCLYRHIGTCCKRLGQPALGPMAYPKEGQESSVGSLGPGAATESSVRLLPSCYYAQMDEGAVFNYFTDVANKSVLPIITYNYVSRRRSGHRPGQRHAQQARLSLQHRGRAGGRAHLGVALG